MDRSALPAAALLALGVTLLVAGVSLFPHAGDPAYVHSVEQIAADDVPPEANVTNVTALSPEGRAAFRNALESEDGTYVVRDEADRPPDLFYSDHAEIDRGIYVVRSQGEYYRLSTSAGGGFGFIAYGIKLLLGAVGVLFALVGGASLYLGRERLPIAAWAGLGGVALVFLLRTLRLGVVPYGLVQWLPVAAAAFVAAAALGYRYAPADA
jgi:hypothetical protein